MNDIMLCGREGDASVWALLYIKSQIKKRFPDRNVIDNLAFEPGDDIGETIENTLRSSAALVVLIGKRWSGDTKETLLSKPNDIIRMMVEKAFALNKPLIPVLVDGASMPNSIHLPNHMQLLAKLNALNLRNDKVEDDLQILLSWLEKAIEGSGISVSSVIKASYNIGEVVSIKSPTLVHTLAFSPDGKSLVGGISKKGVEIWDVPSGRHQRTIQQNQREVYAVAISPDGNWLASASGHSRLPGKCDIQLWRMSNGEHRLTIDAHWKAINALVFSPDSKTLASAAKDNQIKVWDVASGLQKTTLKGHRKSVNDLVFSPDGKYLVSCSEDGTLLVWDFLSGKQVGKASGDSPVHAVAVSSDGKTIASAACIKWYTGGDQYTISVPHQLGTVKLWKIPEVSEVKTIESSELRFVHLAFLAEGNILAGMARDDLERPPSKDFFKTSGREAQFVLWSMPNGEELLRDKIDAWHMRLSPKSGLLATAKHDSIMVWQIF